jgi:hypothetical protein
MFISHKHRFIFFHIPKTAGSTLEKELCRQLGENEWRTKWACPAWGTGTGRGSQEFTKHMRPWLARKRLGRDLFNSYFKFSTVRNPWDWHLSFYSMLTQWPKFASPLGHYAKNHGGRVHPMNDYKDFNEYITLGSKGTGCGQLREYGSPCSRFLQDTDGQRAASKSRRLLVDDVISLENMDADLNRIFSRLDLDPPDMTRRDPKVTSCGEPWDCSSRHPPAGEVYSKNTWNIIKSLNTVDILRFNWGSLSLET